MSGTLRRILLVVEPGGAPPAALQSAVRLAAELNAGLDAVFLEDDDLFEAICGPGARLVNAYGQAVTVADFNLIRRAVRVHATQTREALATAAAERSAVWSFAMVRGRIREQVTVRAEAPDMVVLIAPARRAGSLSGFIENVYELCQCVEQPLLLLRPDAPLERAITVVFGGRPETLEVAVELAAKTAAPLSVCVTGDGAQSIDRNEQAALRWLDDHGHGVALQRLAPDTDIARLDADRPGLLVVDRAAVAGDTERLRALLSARHGSVLLVA